MVAIRAKRAETPQNTPSSAYAQPQKSKSMLYIIIGLIFAVLSLAVFPEIFGGLAMIIGAYAWRLEVAESHNRGILVILLGFVFMIAGWYVTAQYGLWDILY